MPKATSRRVKIVDRLGGWVIRFGGVSVIAAVAAIFVFVGREALPLFRGAEARRFIQAPAPVCAPNAPVMGVDEYETCAFWLDPAGVFRLTTLDGLKPAGELPVPQLQKHPLASGYRSPARNHLYLGTRDGHVLLAQLKFNPAYTASGRVVTAALNEEALVEVSPSGSAVEKVFGRHDGTAAVFAALCADGKIYSGRWEEGEDAKVEEVRGELAGRVTHLAIDGQGRKLFAATDDGRLHLWYLEKSAEKPFRVHELGAGRAITAMDWAIGDNALLLGFRDGAIEQWFGVREQRNEVLRSFRKIRAFDPLPAAVTALAPSGRDKGFVAGARDGTVRLCFTTSGRTLLSLEAGGEVSALCYAPKLTSVLAGTTAGRATGWAIDNPHPEISWQTLFGKVWYEGYDAPEYNWQSTGGSDDFESKFSLVPLVVGTLKGAFYGLLFAIPVAVMAAIYVAQFMHLQLRTLVKPTVEIMAALPSVVIGFLAGLWLAPLMERQFLSVLAMFVLVPVLVLVAVSVWHHLPVRLTQRVPHGMELALIVPLIAAASAVAARLGPGIDGWFFHGDFRQWVFNTFGEQFEQRNSIVIGFAMGFAVIPIIFTIAEDALSNVPQHFVSGSLALGASRWQTAVHIVLPTASPGIFSAIMVGFGRAVGETMIVLMATGNTPILSFSPFNGMRTLSANIAVEIPEAPVGGTLYRVLFLAAILLFVLTFVVNTAADIIRQRLREKYKAV